MRLVKINWIRHGESTTNVIGTEGAWYDQWKRLAISDPPLTERGAAAAQSMIAPVADLVVSSRLLRAMQTALLLYPDDYVHVLCGNNELMLGPPCNPGTKTSQQAHVSTVAWRRLLFSVNASSCSWLESRNFNRFKRELRAVAAPLAAKLPPGQILNVSVVGHSCHMGLFLGFHGMDNLATRTTLMRL
jgi:hypothetical protein